MSHIDAWVISWGHIGFKGSLQKSIEHSYHHTVNGGSRRRGVSQKHMASSAGYGLFQVMFSCSQNVVAVVVVLVVVRMKVCVPVAALSPL